MGAYQAELRHVAETEGIEKARWIDATLRAILRKIRRDEARAAWQLNVGTEIAMLLPDGIGRDEACSLIEAGIDFIERERGLR